MDTKQDIEQTLADPLGGISAGLDSATGTQGGSLAWERRQAEERLAEAQRQREAEAERHRQQHGSVHVFGQGEVPEGATVHVTVTVAAEATEVVMTREPISGCGWSGGEDWTALPETIQPGTVWEGEVLVCGGAAFDLTWEGASRADAAKWVTLDVAPNWTRPEQEDLSRYGFESAPDEGPLIRVTRDGVAGADR